MPNPPLEIGYNENLGPLEKLLKGVKRTGDYFVRDTVELPLPKVEIDGFGLLSFPLPEAQAKALIRKAELAPYGRGPDTILDTSVRKVWQLPAGLVHLSGKSWGGNFDQVLSRVAAGLGCGQIPISAELYKLLVYDQGGFFLSHRDTEKAPGMFGTLIVVLPSAHEGGDLVVRHAGREVTLDMSNAGVSELTFAAFYADCEHEVRPVTQGYRVCLVYNLIQQPGPGGGKRKGPMGAPLYDREAVEVGRILEQALTAPAAPAKLAWLLEHQYTPAELSFATLKNADAARTKVLVEAATRAGCAVHLGIVHIEESGSAESKYGGYRRGRSRWGWHREADEEEDGEGEDVDFEIVEASNSEEYIDGWIDPGNRKAELGQVPLAEGELLPQGALDGEKPDQQRYTEASGNEGASYERAYHRAVVVLWRRERYAGVLLQTGVGAALPYLREKSEAARAPGATEAARREARELAVLLVRRWDEAPGSGYGVPDAKRAERPQMLDALCEIKDIPLLERFIADIVARDYDGTENAALARAAKLLGPAPAGRVFTALLSANTRWFPHGCADLLRRLARLRTGAAAAAWEKTLLGAATAVVAGLGAIRQVRHPGRVFGFGMARGSGFIGEEDLWEQEPEPAGDAAGEELDWRRRSKLKPLDPAVVVRLFEALAALDARELGETAAETIAVRKGVFDPIEIVVPALAGLKPEPGSAGEPAFVRLWHHAADFLLARGERPPEPPKDWHQEATIKCQCKECRALEWFARDPLQRVHRFVAAGDRRAHVESTILQYGLDITHETERKTRPFTLVCTKTQGRFERRCRRYHQEITAMAALLPLSPAASEGASAKLARLEAAITRSQAFGRSQAAAE